MTKHQKSKVVSAQRTQEVVRETAVSTLHRTKKTVCRRRIRQKDDPSAAVPTASFENQPCDDTIVSNQLEVETAAVMTQAQHSLQPRHSLQSSHRSNRRLLNSCRRSFLQKRSTSIPDSGSELMVHRPWSGCQKVSMPKALQRQHHGVSFHNAKSEQPFNFVSPQPVSTLATVKSHPWAAELASRARCRRLSSCRHALLRPQPGTGKRTSRKDWRIL